MKESSSNKEMRKIIINDNQIKHYVDNTIKTAKYNWFTFLPLAIIYQFNNYFNIFFLITAIILAIKEISPMDPGVAIGPFIFVIMVSVIREGIEDFKKSSYDKTYNNSVTICVNKENKEEKLKWSNVQVGSILKIFKNEVIPADILIIKTSLDNGFCYMETTNLDGESSLKPREALPLFTDKVSEISDFFKLKGKIECDQPNCNIYSVNGTVLVQVEGDSTEKRAFLKIDNVLLRGTSLKNVDWVYGLVLYTGRDTKIMKNIQTFSLKNSSIEKTLNKVIIVVIIIVFSICIACTVFGMIFLSANVPKYELDQRRSEYIYYAKSENFSYTLEFFALFGAFFIIFNNIIPISLTITFEIAKFIQVWFISKDTKMFDEEKDEKFKILSMKLQEDLGNVKYIFTDKTGTLTKNEMIFRACSIYSKLFFEEKKNDEMDELDANNYDENDAEKNSNNNAKNASNQNNPPPFQKSVFSPLFDLPSIENAMHCDLPIEIDEIENSYYKSTRDSIIEFFLNIALNHNVLTEIQGEDMIYQGANPDEVTLVTAAKQIGVKYLGRVGNIITIDIDNNLYQFEVLQKFEFSSERARSSIIVKDLNTSEIKLFIKGSDEKLLKIIDTFSYRNLEFITKEHLEKFAKSGLRTLCYGVKVIPQSDYDEWKNKYEEIKYKFLLNQQLKKDLENQIENIEEECLLLGVSGLEDRLQDEVKDTIEQILEAGIQTWMITGDKLDTAESIGYASKIFDDDTEVFKIRSTENKQEILTSMKKLLEDIALMEKQMNLMKLEKKKRKGKKKNPNKSDSLEKEKKLRDDNGDRKTEFKIELIPNASEEQMNGSFQKEKIENVAGGTETNLNNIFTPKLESVHEYSNTVRFSAVDNKIFTEFGKKRSSDQIFRNKTTTKYKMQNLNLKEKIMNLNDSVEDESPSQVDDVSVIKFIYDNNFLNESIMDKKEFAHTFMNHILKVANNANNSSQSVIKKNLDELGNNIKYQANIINDEERKNLNLKNGETPIEIRINQRNNIEIEIKNDQSRNDSENRDSSNRNYNADPLALKDGEECEEIDLSNLYEHYQKELNKFQERKESVRKILKFTNLDFAHFKKKKSEEEEHDMKDVNLLNFGLIIEGSAINFCLDDEVKTIFWKLIKKSRAVICCRCNPIQKSDIVNFVKKKSGEVCLSIGDGGNDVNMLKAANVGIGIFGKEGYQAAYNSDYAISQFKYLKRLLFYHGRYSLLRNTYFIYFFFYKSLIFCVPNLWFAFFSGFSGTLLWDNLYMILYTSIISTMPPVVIMVFEEDIDITFEDYQNKEILIKLVPDIYKEYRDSSPFNSLKFFIVFLLGCLHSAVIYFFPLFVVKFGIQDQTGRCFSVWDQSLLGIMTVLIVQYFIIFQDTNKYFMPVIMFHTIQILVNVILFVLYASLGSDQLGAYTYDIVSNIKFWFVLVITLAIDLLFVIISRKIDNLLSDTIINNLRNRKYEDDYTKKLYMKKIEHMSKWTRYVARFKKIYNNNNYEADTYADRKMKELVEKYRKNNKKSKCVSPGKNKITKSKSLDFGKELKEKINTLTQKIQNLKKRRSSNFREVVVPHDVLESKRTDFLFQKNTLNNAINVDIEKGSNKSGLEEIVDGIEAKIVNFPLKESNSSDQKN